MRPHASSQRRAILQVMASTNTPLSALQIWQQSQGEHEVALSTVYRTLALMRHRRWLRTIYSPDGERYYKLGQKSGTYFFCRMCGIFVSMPQPHPHVQVEKVAARGFQVEDFDLIFRGRCLKCLPEKTLKVCKSRDFSQLVK